MSWTAWYTPDNRIANRIESGHRPKAKWGAGRFLAFLEIDRAVFEVLREFAPVLLPVILHLLGRLSAWSLRRAPHRIRIYGPRGEVIKEIEVRRR
jgi:hypothetical protein